MELIYLETNALNMICQLIVIDLVTFMKAIPNSKLIFSLYGNLKISIGKDISLL